MKYTTILNNEQYEVEILDDGAVLVNGQRREVDFLDLGGALYSIITDNKSLEVAIDEDQGEYEVLLDGRLYDAQVLDARALLMAQRKGGLGAGSGEVNAPMPGLIVEVLVEEGDVVAEGQTVVILESMKMQNELKSPIAGTVQTVTCNAQETVDKNALLVNIASDEEEEA